ncbi:MAG: ATP-dependent helicase [Treponema sp.]|nr:ATP-dependent helicase [Treponema sp.]
MTEVLAHYLSLLNEQQKQAVEHSGSPLLILAGAGSGKTRVITTKIAYLISEKGFKPWQILAVTFTKKAAKEMQDRAVQMEGQADQSMIRTFHSFGSWFLRKYYEEAGVAQNFTVYDDDDMVTLVSKANPGLEHKQATSAAHKISLAKDYCLLPDSPGLAEISSDPNFPDIYKNYQNRLRSTGNVDFGDLIMLPVLILQKFPQVKAQMSYRFKVIMVDEYQDSNIAQFKLLRELCSDGSDGNEPTYVCVVGDDDQSIYKFRGAEVQNILNFQDEFPGTTLIKLERNYRSTAKILNCADKVVSNNEDRLGKTLIADRGEGKKPVLTFLPNQDLEAKFCADLILGAHAKGVPFNDWAILYRTNAQSLSFESEFLHQKIPYAVIGSLKFYEREEIKDMLAFLSLCANPRDEISFRRIINKPTRSLGEKTQDKIVEEFRKNEVPENLIEVTRSLMPSMSKKAKEGAAQFISIMDQLIGELPYVEIQEEDLSEQALADETKTAEQKSLQTKIDSSKHLSDFVQKIMEITGLEEYHAAQDEIAKTQKVANMQELVNSAVLYEYSTKGLIEFIDHIELDRTMENEEDAGADTVTLITLHNTKGLEFPRVVITGLEAGIFPRQDKSGSELEEERRLFYVGITRAMDELYITSCSMRRLYGRTQMMEPSQFLAEAGSESFKVLGSKPASYEYKVAGSGLGNSLKPKGEWAVGTKIYHDDYGYGVVTKNFEREGEMVIFVQFESGGTKTFLPEYQKHSLMKVKD